MDDQQSELGADSFPNLLTEARLETRASVESFPKMGSFLEVFAEFSGYYVEEGGSVGWKGLAEHLLGRNFIGVSIGTPILTKMLPGMLERMSEKGLPGLIGLANHLLGRNFIVFEHLGSPILSQRCCLECWRR